MSATTESRIEPGSVIILSAEDDPARTIKLRLQAAGADMNKVGYLDSTILIDGSEALPSLKSDIDVIEDVAVGLDDCRLIVIDPVSAYLDGVDDHNNAELRAVLTPLKSLAERLNIAIVLVSHLTKTSGANAKHRVTGSIAYHAACRANFLFVKDRADPDGRRVLLCDNGCNLAEGPIPTLAFRIVKTPDGPVMSWEHDSVDITADEALAAEIASLTESRPQRDATKTEECKAWLREVLAGEPVLQKEIEAAAKQAGFTMATCNVAKQKIGAESFRQGFGKDSQSFWRVAP